MIQYASYSRTELLQVYSPASGKASVPSEAFMKLRAFIVLGGNSKLRFVPYGYINGGVVIR